MTKDARWRMPGGMVFGRYRKDAPGETRSAPEPSQVIIPVGLPQPDLSLAIGDPVCTGQPLVPHDNVVPRQFHLSSVTGTVAGFIAHGRGMRAPVSILLDRADGEDRCGETFASPVTAQAAREALVQTGVIHACEPEAGRWLQRPGPPPEALLVACFASAPMAACRGVGAVHDQSRFLQGLALWRLAAGEVPVVLMVAQDEAAAWERLEPLPEGTTLRPCPRRYPAEHPLLLACRYLGRSLPGGSTPLDAGLLVIDIPAVSAAGEVAATREPLHHVHIALVGEGVPRPGVMRVRIGTRAGDLLRAVEASNPLLVAGGVLAGHHLDSDSPILPHHGTLVALPRASRRFLGFMGPAVGRPSWSATVLSSFLPWIRHRARAELGGERRPCISCGACEAVCPREISPSHLARLADDELVEEMEALGIDRCIECGLCSYVCPSKLELMASIRGGIQTLAREHAA